MENNFTEKDSDNLVKLLNLIASNARFDLDVKEIIQMYGLLAWSQQELKSKINGNILEIKNIVNPESPKPKKKKGK